MLWLRRKRNLQTIEVTIISPRDAEGLHGQVRATALRLRSYLLEHTSRHGDDKGTVDQDSRI